MTEDCLRPGVTLDVIKETEAHIGEDSSFTFYPSPARLKWWKRNHLVFPRLFLGTQHEKIKIRIANIYRHSRFFLATNNAVIRLEEAQKLNSIGVVRGNTMDVF